MLRRWGELSSQKKREACKRVGEEVSTVRGWLEELGEGVWCICRFVDLRI